MMTLQNLLIATLVLMALWFLYRRTINVPAMIDLEATDREFHAHVVLDGVEIAEGDEVLVHGAPSFIALNEKRTMQATATVLKASLPRRAWERVVGRTRFRDMYEVGFEG
jgi:hypothetical protein